MVHIGNHRQYQDKETHSESVLIGSGGGFVALCLIIQWAHIDCNVCTPLVESTLRNREAGSAYRLSPQSPVSKEARIKLWGITTHIQAKGSKFP